MIQQHHLSMKFWLGSLGGLLIGLYLSGCQHGTSTANKLLPDWVTNPQDQCPQAYLCGVGSGHSIAQADQQARADLAAYFKVNITKGLSSQQWEQQVVKGASLEGQAQSREQSYLESQLEQLLEGSAVAQRFIHQDREFYSFVQLKREILWKRLEQHQSELLKQYREVTAQQARFAQFKLTVLHSQWQEWQFMRKLVADPKLGAQWPQAQPRTGRPVWLQLSAPLPWKKELQAVFQHLIITAGHQVAAERAGAHDILEVQLEMETRPIEGFLQGQVKLRAVGHSVVEQPGAKGLMLWDQTLTARTQDQLRNKALDLIRQQVPQDLYQTGL